MLRFRKHVSRAVEKDVAVTAEAEATVATAATAATDVEVVTATVVEVEVASEMKSTTAADQVEGEKPVVSAAKPVTLAEATRVVS